RMRARVRGGRARGIRARSHRAARRAARLHHRRTGCVHMSIARGDAVALTRALVQVDSRNPSLVPHGPGEGAVARLLCDVLEAWGMRTELVVAAPGRPNVVARVGT